MGTILLWGITILWLIFICYLCKGKAFPDKLNEIGDFFAGAFAPLAFLWLVFGFYQQGRGLKQNSEALRIQVAELKQSTRALNLQVDEQKKLLKTTEKQIKINNEKNNFDKFYLKKQLQPFFHFSDLEVCCECENDTFDSLLVMFKISNSRTICRNIFFTYAYEEGSAYKILKHRNMNILRDSSEGGVVSFNISNEPFFDSSNSCELIIIINYTDAVDKLQMQKITLHLKKDSFQNISLDRHVYGEQTLY